MRFVSHIFPSILSAFKMRKKISNTIFFRQVLVKKKNSIFANLRIPHMYMRECVHTGYVVFQPYVGIHLIKFCWKNICV